MNLRSPRSEAPVDPAPSVLIADCDHLFVRAATRVLQGRGYEVRNADCRQLEPPPEDLASFSHLVLELAPDGVPRLRMLAGLRSLLGDAVIVVASAYPSLPAAVA